jgi:hypothetical protein
VAKKTIVDLKLVIRYLRGRKSHVFKTPYEAAYNMFIDKIVEDLRSVDWEDFAKREQKEKCESCGREIE